MPLFVVLTTVTAEGGKTLKESPERIKAVNKEVEAMGVKILGQYVLLGPYDFLNIVEAPSNEIVAKMAIDLSSRGTLRTLTMAAVSVDDLIKTLKK